MLKQIENLTTSDRLQGLLKAILSENSIIPKPFHSVIMSQVGRYLTDTNEEELKTQIKKLRDEIIPFILGE